MNPFDTKVTKETYEKTKDFFARYDDGEHQIEIDHEVLDFLKLLFEQRLQKSKQVYMMEHINISKDKIYKNNEASAKVNVNVEGLASNMQKELDRAVFNILCIKVFDRTLEDIEDLIKEDQLNDLKEGDV